MFRLPSRFTIPAIGAAASLLVSGGVLAVLTDTVTFNSSAESSVATIDLIEVAPVLSAGPLVMTCQSLGDAVWEPADSLPGSLAEIDTSALASSTTTQVATVVNYCIRAVGGAPLQLGAQLANVLETEISTLPNECAAEITAYPASGGCVVGGPNSGELSNVIQLVVGPVTPGNRSCLSSAGNPTFANWVATERGGSITSTNTYTCQLHLQARVIPVGLTAERILAVQTDRVQFDLVLTATPS